MFRPVLLGLYLVRKAEFVGLDRTVVSMMHCGCIDPGSIPGLDMHPYFTCAHVRKSISHFQVYSSHADGKVARHSGYVRT